MTKKKPVETPQQVSEAAPVASKRKPYRPRAASVVPDDTLLKAEQVAQMIAPAYPISGIQAVIGAVAFAHATIMELLRQQQVGE